MPTLTIKITCGENTCAGKSGVVFCKFVGVLPLAKGHCCRLFPDGDFPFTELRDRDGWLQRCDGCMNAARPPEATHAKSA